MSSTEIKVGGLGGQGVILAGMIIGRGASIFADKHATLTQSFGPEARGSACSAQILIADDPVEYPYVHHPDILVVMSQEAYHPDILVVMSQEAYHRFAPALSPTGTMLYESDLVTPAEGLAEGIARYGVPATRIAEELLRPVVLNIVMVGFFAAMTNVVRAEALRESVEASVPAGTESLNLTAFDRGFAFGQELLAGKAPTAAATPA